ncbi:MAG: type 1 glutamine amidotransferase domain-containing protein [Bacteroidales bacterium]
MKKKSFAVLPLLVLLLSGCADQVEETAVLYDQPQVAVLVTEGFQDAEAYMPIGYLTNQGMNITVIGPDTGRVKAYNSDFTIDIKIAVEDLTVEGYDALILPGGKAPAALKENSTVVAFVKEFSETGKPVASICHGPQVLAAAGVLEGKTCTAVGSVQEELEDAGATFVDQELVIDGNLITSRTPPDLPAFCQAIDEAIEKSFEPEMLTPTPLPG